jgi:hypothetical protein
MRKSPFFSKDVPMDSFDEFLEKLEENAYNMLLYHSFEFSKNSSEEVKRIFFILQLLKRTH